MNPHGELPQSALALITQGNEYVLQQRPDLPGRLPYPGKIHFFGGGIHVGQEKAYAAVFRELCEEETNARRDVFSDPELLWEGRYMGENKHGKPVRRHIHLFGLQLDPDFELRPTEQEAGDVVKLSQNIDAVYALGQEGRLAPFALEALSSHLLNEGVVRIEEAPDTSYLH